MYKYWVLSSIVSESILETRIDKGMEQTQYLHYWKELPQLLYVHVIVFHLLYHLPCLQSYTLKGLTWESYGSGLSELANTATISSYVYIQAVLLLYILSKLWINFRSWIRHKDVFLPTNRPYPYLKGPPGFLSQQGVIVFHLEALLLGKLCCTTAHQHAQWGMF